MENSNEDNISNTHSTLPAASSATLQHQPPSRIHESNDVSSMDQRKRKRNESSPNTNTNNGFIAPVNSTLILPKIFNGSVKLKTHQQLIKRYQSAVLRELKKDEQLKSVGTSDEANKMTSTAGGNQSNDKGWTVEDFLNMDISDCFPDDYGIDFMEEGCLHPSIGKDPIMKHMPIREISDLIGIANASNTYGGENVNITLKNNPKMKRSLLPSWINRSNSGSGRDIEKKEYDKFAETRMHMPSNSTPPKPSHLHFLLECASHKIFRSQIEAKQASIAYQESCLRDEEIRNKILNAAEDQCTSHSAEIETTLSDDEEGSVYHKYFKSYDINKTMREYVHNQQNQGQGRELRNESNNIDHEMNQKKKIEKEAHKILLQKSKQLENLYGQFDETALVALGMFLEESLTASLLPLAKEHVARCRQLEQKNHYQRKSVQRLQSSSGGNYARNTVKKSILESNDDPFIQWTLPPEEAISLTSLCSSGTSNNKQHNQQHQESKQAQEHASLWELREWSSAHGIDYEVVCDNLDLFHTFFQGSTKQSLKDLHLRNLSKNENDVKKSILKACSDKEILDDHTDRWSIPKININIED